MALAAFVGSAVEIRRCIALAAFVCSSSDTRPYGVAFAAFVGSSSEQRDA